MHREQTKVTKQFFKNFRLTQMATPTSSIRAISPNNPSGTKQAPSVNMSSSQDVAAMAAGMTMPKLANYGFGAGIIVFIVVFSGTWILLVSFTPKIILVDDCNNKGHKAISYGLAIMWSILFSLIIMLFSSLCIWLAW